MLVRSQPERRRAPRVRGAHSAAAYFRQPAPAGRSLPQLWGRCWMVAQVAARCHRHGSYWRATAPLRMPSFHRSPFSVMTSPACWDSVPDSHQILTPPLPAPNCNPTGVTGRLRNQGTYQAAAAHQAGTAMVSTHCSPSCPSPHHSLPCCHALPLRFGFLPRLYPAEALGFVRVPAPQLQHHGTGKALP